MTHIFQSRSEKGVVQGTSSSSKSVMKHVRGIKGIMGTDFREVTSAPPAVGFLNGVDGVLKVEMDNFFFLL